MSYILTVLTWIWAHSDDILGGVLLLTLLANAIAYGAEKVNAPNVAKMAHGLSFSLAEFSRGFVGLVQRLRGKEPPPSSGSSSSGGELPPSFPSAGPPAGSARLILVGVALLLIGCRPLTPAEQAEITQEAISIGTDLGKQLAGAACERGPNTMRDGAGKLFVQLLCKAGKAAGIIDEKGTDGGPSFERPRVIELYLEESKANAVLEGQR